MFCSGPRSSCPSLPCLLSIGKVCHAVDSHGVVRISGWAVDVSARHLVPDNRLDRSTSFLRPAANFCLKISLQRLAMQELSRNLQVFRSISHER